jgi:hypothetical protein
LPATVEPALNDSDSAYARVKNFLEGHPSEWKAIDLPEPWRHHDDWVDWVGQLEESVGVQRTADWVAWTAATARQHVAPLQLVTDLIAQWLAPQPASRMADLLGWLPRLQPPLDGPAQFLRDHLIGLVVEGRLVNLEALAQELEFLNAHLDRLDEEIGQGFHARNPGLTPAGTPGGPRWWSLSNLFRRRSQPQSITAGPVPVEEEYR